MIVPDSVTGAVVLSLIDFFLSIVMISGIGVVLGLFPLLNRIARLEDDKLRRGNH